MTDSTANNNPSTVDYSLHTTARVRGRVEQQLVAELDLGRVPTSPGCYLIQDVRQKPIYVGKAKNLRARIRAYIHETDGRPNVKLLMRRAHSLEFLVTRTEKEALLLENSLIKTHQPKYNIRLKDDKTYISLRLDPREDFPRITIVRRYKRDGARYFGPFHQSQVVRKTLRQLQTLFPLRHCADGVMRNRARPCLYHQMKQCLAPCTGQISREEYHALVEQVLLVLEGRTADLERRLLEQIAQHAERLEFEEAASLRDRLFQMRQAFERQRATGVAGAEEQDVFAIYNEGRFSEVQALFYRGGNLAGGRSFSFDHEDVPVEELFCSFLLQYYSEAVLAPAEILLPVPLEEAEILEEILGERRGSRVRLLCPQRGEKKALIDLALRNAQKNFHEKRLEEKAAEDLLEQVRATLHLPRLPRRIECFDISTLQGTNTVASMAVFTDARPDKARYRHYRMKQVSGQDDFASLREAITRRYTRALAENDLPDLALIDGGKGQLGVAVAALHDLGLSDLPCAGIAKSRTQEEGEASPERFFIPGRANPIVPPQNGPVVKLLARLRDEAHRFAVEFHRKQRSGSTLRTTLAKIPGIGPKRARALLQNLGSVALIREAAPEQIQAVPGFNQALALAVFSHFHPPEPGSLDKPSTEAGGTDTRDA